MLSPEYVLEEICQVIIARKIPDSEAYKEMKGKQMSPLTSVLACPIRSLLC